MNRRNRTILVLALTFLFSVLLRWPDLPLANFSALGAFALFAGSLTRRPWLAVLLALACRLCTDFVLQATSGNAWFSDWAFTYAAYALIAVVGTFVNPRSSTRVLAGGLLTPVIFFFVSNFGSWLLMTQAGGAPVYPRSVAGLLECYWLGLPYAKGTLLGDFLFSLAFFGIWSLIESHCEVPAAVPAPVSRRS